MNKVKRRAANPRGRYEQMLFNRLVLLVAVPLCAMSILLGASYFSQEDARQRAGLQSVRTSAQDALHNVLNNLREYYLGITQDDDFTWLLSSQPPYARTPDVSAAQTVLRGGSYLSAYVSGYTYFNLQHGWVLSSNGVFRMSEVRNYEQMQTFLNEQPDVSSTLYWLNNTAQAAPGLGSRQVDLSGFLLVVRTNNFSGNMQQLLVVQLDSDALLRDTSEWRAMGYEVALLDSDGLPILATNADLAAQLSDRLAAGHTIDSRVGSYLIEHTELGVGRLSLYIGYNTQLDYSFVLTLLAVFLLVAAASVVVLALCRWNSAFLYRPIRQLIDQVDESVFGTPADGEDEFAYLTHGVTRVAEDQRLLRDIVKRQRSQLLQRLLQGLLHNELTMRGLQSSLAALEVEPAGYYQLLLLDLGLSDKNAPERDALTQTVVQHLPPPVTRRCFLCPLAVDGTVVMVAYGATREALRADFQALYLGATQMIRTNVGVNCTAGASQVYEAPERTATAWHEALEALRSSASPTQGSGPQFYTPPESSQVSAGYNDLLENEVMAAATACNRKECARLISLFIDRLGEQGVRGYERQFYVQRLVSALLTVAETAGLSVNKLLADRPNSLFDAVGRIYRTEEMKTFLIEQVADPVMEMLSDFRQNSSSELVKNVIALIQKTGGDLTLNECAEQLNYSPSYIWKVLKAERDTNFTDLVSQQKIEMAKELLLTSDKTVAQVAEELHYANVQNFIRFFSREVGMTPGRFKKEHQSGAAKKKAR